ncbi:hypothetical protein DEALK_02030 [Dehalogenimonas alkenigignens]|uniref:Mycothiol-dependent maleylpyruvate isomerase metal-binding domain-containing protein n=1 Tax=Dehalogenimonas alkenigignens TaxID=1217799 RepID=A0A0W0GL50_9CHLR|nr:hypothetical protein [Dehalogenimonas alkenigignens]KTB49290.1 hypothetical protein DEALK_02030 [Dehalogenimonas alkenigignens]
MNMETVVEMIRMDRVEWDLLTGILDDHPHHNLHGSGSPWTSRDVYAHLARWISYSNNDMEACCAGREISPPIENIEEMNSGWHQEDSRMTLAEARQKAHDAFNRRILIIQSIRPDRWNKDLEKIARYDGVGHLSAHRSYINI